MPIKAAIPLITCALTPLCKTAAPSNLGLPSGTALAWSRGSREQEQGESGAGGGGVGSRRRGSREQEEGESGAGGGGRVV